MSEALNGSNTLPATLELVKDVQIQLGELVRYSFEQTGLTAEKWNALNDAGRDEWLNSALEELKELAADGKLPKSITVLPPEGAAPAKSAKAKRGEEIDKTHHLHPDYAGALTGDQALQRHERGLVEARIKSHKPTAK